MWKPFAWKKKKIYFWDLFWKSWIDLVSPHEQTTIMLLLPFLTYILKAYSKLAFWPCGGFFFLWFNFFSLSFLLFKIKQAAIKKTKTMNDYSFIYTAILSWTAQNAVIEHFLSDGSVSNHTNKLLLAICKLWIISLNEYFSSYTSIVFGAKNTSKVAPNLDIARSRN